MKRISIIAVACALALSACGGKEARLQEHLEKGRAFLAQEDFDKARVEFKNVLQINPKNVDGTMAMAQLLEKQQNWAQAAGTYQRVIELDATRTDAKTRLARLYLLGGAPDKARELIDEVLKTAPQNPDALVVRAGLGTRKGDNRNAEDDVKAALASAPGHLDATMLLAGLYNNTDRVDQAITLLRDAIAKNAKEISLRLALADIYAKREQSEPAIETLQDILQLQPKALSLRVRLASYLVRLKRIDDGEKVLRAGVAQDETNSDAKLALISFLGSQHGFDAAQTQLQQFITAEPKLYALQFALARMQDGNNHADTAKSVLEGIVKSDNIGPDGLRARTTLALMKAKQGDKDGALILANQVLRENPKDNDALIVRASLALDQRDAVGAIADLRTVLKDQPTASNVIRLLASAHVLNNEPQLAHDYLQKGVEANPADNDLRYLYAQLLVQIKQVDKAIEQYQMLAKVAPDNGVYVDSLFKAQAQKGDWLAARVIATQLKDAHPNHPLGYYFAGLVEQQVKNYPASIKEFETALQKNPEASEPLSALVKTYLILKQPQKALAQLQKIVAQSPKNSLAHNLLGEIYAGQNDLHNAEQEFLKARVLNPNSVLAYRDLAALKLLQKDSDAAIRIYREGLKATGDDASLVFALAVLYERKGEYDPAIALYDELIERDPTSQAAMNNLAMVLASYKSDPQSLERAKELAARLKGTNNPAYLDTVGWVQYKRSEYDVAVATLGEALRAAPDEPMLRYHLGMALYKKGDAAQAKENLKKAVDAKVNFAGIDDARATLAKL